MHAHEGLGMPILRMTFEVPCLCTQAFKFQAVKLKPEVYHECVLHYSCTSLRTTFRFTPTITNYN